MNLVISTKTKGVKKGISFMDNLENILKEKKCLKCWNITCNVHIEKKKKKLLNLLIMCAINKETC